MPADLFRRNRFASLADFDSGVGLEFGPLDRPIVLKSEHVVHYLDVFDTEGIREHYLHDPGVGTDDLVELDFWLRGPDGEMRDLVDVVGAAAPFRWVVASHVIEHVPNLIGWLSDVASILEDGGTLLLAVPDRRYSFDALRPPTTIGQMLQAHESRDAVPSIRAVYDYFRTVVRVAPGDIWAGAMPTEDDRAHDLEATLGQVERARDKSRYIDCHVWLFNPVEFVEQIDELGRLNLVEFTVDRIIPTAVDELEFYAALTRTPRHRSTAVEGEERLRSQQNSAELIAELRALPATRIATIGPPAEAATPPEAGPQSEPPSDAETSGGSRVVENAPGSADFPLSLREIRLIRNKRRVMSVLRRWRFER